MARTTTFMLLACLCGGGFVFADESSPIAAWSAAPWLNGASSNKVKPKGGADGGLAHSLVFSVTTPATVPPATTESSLAAFLSGATVPVGCSSDPGTARAFCCGNQC